MNKDFWALVGLLLGNWGYYILLSSDSFPIAFTIGTNVGGLMMYFANVLYIDPKDLKEKNDKI